MILLLSASEESLGRALTETEVVNIARAVAASRINPRALQPTREHHRFGEITPENAWPTWQEVRLKLFKN